jgi:hypothetical protein
MRERTWWETVEAKSGEIVDKVQALIAEGNVRRVRIRQQSRVIAEFPLTVGVVGAVLAPMLAAIGAVAALLTDCSIDVEKVERDSTKSVAPPEPDTTTAGH